MINIVKIMEVIHLIIIIHKILEKINKQFQVIKVQICKLVKIKIKRIDLVPYELIIELVNCYSYVIFFS